MQQSSHGMRKVLAACLLLVLGVIIGGLLVSIFSRIPGSSLEPSADQKFHDLLSEADESSTSPYTVVIDCGSTGSRLYVYYASMAPPQCGVDDDVAKLGGNRKLWDVTDYCGCPAGACEPNNSALSSFQDDPNGAGTMIGNLAKNAQRYVPAKYAAKTPVFAYATAGMRLIPTDRAQQIWDSVRKNFLSGNYAKDSKIYSIPFKFNALNAKDLPGNYEGVFQYLTVQNILNDGDIDTAFNNNSTIGLGPRGIIEMGGASLQVSFQPDTAIDDDAVEFYIDRVGTTIFSTSYLGFGKEAAFDRASSVLVEQHPGDDNIDHPCLYKGYKMRHHKVGDRKVTFEGTGNPAECRKLVKGLLHLDYECIQKPCSIMGIYQPLPNEKHGKFIGIGGIYYAAYNLGLVGWSEAKEISPEKIYESTEDNCQVPWHRLGTNPKYGEAFNVTEEHFYKVNCFVCMLVSELLSAFGFVKDSASIVYSRNLANPPLSGKKGMPLTWTRGATLFKTLYMPGHGD